MGGLFSHDRVTIVGVNWTPVSFPVSQTTYHPPSEVVDVQTAIPVVAMLTRHATQLVSQGRESLAARGAFGVAEAPA